jgi:hypothetical protein
MSETFNGVLSVALDATLQSDEAIGQAVHTIAQRYRTTLSHGDEDNQAENVYVDTRTLASETSEDLDLAGALTNAFGTTLTFTTVKALVVVSRSTNDANILVGGAASNAFATYVADASDKIVVQPGGLVALRAPKDGYAVTASTGDLLKIDNTSTEESATYDIIIVGTTA